MKEIARLVINEKLPSLNDYIARINRNKYIGNTYKRKVQESICWHIKIAKMKPIKKRVDLEVYWHEKTKRRDPDNIYSGMKYILDALQDMKVLSGDGQEQIRHILNYLVIDNVDKVEIIFREVKE